MTHKKFLNFFVLFSFCILLSSCGFHLQGETKLAPSLHRLYLKTSDPYGQLARNLKQYLKLSHVEIVSSAEKATAVLEILQDSNAQELASVSGTQQTRQYNLFVIVAFQITSPEGKIMLEPQTLSESRAITIQANQVLGSSNEANLFYQQMRRALSYSIINRIGSKEVTRRLQIESQPSKHLP